MWQGKRQVDVTTQPLSKAERERISELAVSVWDDDDDGNVGTASDNGNGEASGLYAKHQVDIAYDGNFYAYHIEHLNVGFIAFTLVYFLLLRRIR